MLQHLQQILLAAVPRRDQEVKSKASNCFLSLLNYSIPRYDENKLQEFLHWTLDATMKVVNSITCSAELLTNKISHLAGFHCIIFELFLPRFGSF